MTKSEWAVWENSPRFGWRIFWRWETLEEAIRCCATRRFFFPHRNATVILEGDNG